MTPRYISVFESGSTFLIIYVTSLGTNTSAQDGPIVARVYGAAQARTIRDLLNATLPA